MITTKIKFSGDDDIGFDLYTDNPPIIGEVLRLIVHNYKKTLLVVGRERVISSTFTSKASFTDEEFVVIVEDITEGFSES